MPPGCPPGEVFKARPNGRRPPGRPRPRWRDYVPELVWERLGIPPEELDKGTRERVLPNPNPNKWQMMDEWMKRQASVFHGLYKENVLVKMKGRNFLFHRQMIGTFAAISLYSIIDVNCRVDEKCAEKLLQKNKFVNLCKT